MADDPNGSNQDRARQQAESLARARSDLAASEQALADSLANNAFLERVLNASKDCIKVLTNDGELIFMNSGGQQVMEVDDFSEFMGCAWLSFWEEPGLADAKTALQMAKSGRFAQFQGACATAKGTPKYWDVTLTPIAGRNGGPGHILSISRDITAARESQNQQELLSRELSHRVKNSLSMAQAIAAQTFRGADSGRLAAFNRRMASLGAAQSLLMQRNWTAVSSRALVDRALDPICPTERLETDIDDFELDGHRGLALAMALHELGTNALKYGSLSNNDGKVALSMKVHDRRLNLVWREVGGPAVQPPGRPGFGTRLIKRNLETDFDGTVELNYLPSGVVMNLSAPL